MPDAAQSCWILPLRPLASAHASSCVHSLSTSLLAFARSPVASSNLSISDAADLQSAPAFACGHVAVYGVVGQVRPGAEKPTE